MINGSLLAERNCRDRMLDLAMALEQLTAKQKGALLPWLEGYTQEEIAEMLGITQQQVSRRIERARAEIRLFLDIKGVKRDESD